MCWRDVNDLEDCVALAGGGALRGRSLVGGEGCGEQAGRVRQAANDAVLANVVGRDDVQVVRLRGLVEAFLLARSVTSWFA